MGVKGKRTKRSEGRRKRNQGRVSKGEREKSLTMFAFLGIHFHPKVTKVQPGRSSTQRPLSSSLRGNMWTRWIGFQRDTTVWPLETETKQSSQRSAQQRYSDNETHREHGSENDTSIHPLAAGNRAGIKLHRMSIKSLQREEGEEEEKADDVKSENWLECVSRGGQLQRKGKQKAEEELREKVQREQGRIMK